MRLLFVVSWVLALLNAKICSSTANYHQLCSPCEGIRLEGCSGFNSTVVNLRSCKQEATRRQADAFNYQMDTVNCELLENCPKMGSEYFVDFVKNTGTIKTSVWVRDGVKLNNGADNVDISADTAPAEHPLTPVFGTTRALQTFTALIAETGFVNRFLPIFVDAIVVTLSEIYKTDYEYQQIRQLVLNEIRNALNNRAVDKMRMKIVDLKRTVEHIMGRLQPHNNITMEALLDMQDAGVKIDDLSGTPVQMEEFKSVLTTLELELETSRSDFVLLQDHYLSLPYYDLYATTHIFVLGVHRTLYADTKLVKQYDTEIRDAAKQHHEYLSQAIWELVMLKEISHPCEKLNMNTKSWKIGEDSLTQRLACQMETLEYIYGLQELVVLSRGQINTDTKTKSGDIVSFRYATLENDKWLSCANKDSKCTFQAAKEENNPFQFSCSNERFDNPDMIFKMYSNGKDIGDLVKTCDEVSLLHYDTVDEGSYLSVKYNKNSWKRILPENAGAANLKKCNVNVDEDRKYCAKHSFSLKVPGKQCGDVVLDHDPVVFVSEDLVLAQGSKLRLRIDVGLRAAEGCVRARAWILHKYDSPYSAFLRHRDTEGSHNCQQPV